MPLRAPRIPAALLVALVSVFAVLVTMSFASAANAGTFDLNRNGSRCELTSDGAPVCNDHSSYNGGNFLRLSSLGATSISSSRYAKCIVLEEDDGRGIRPTVRCFFQSIARPELAFSGKAVSVGGYHLCYLRPDDRVACQGSNWAGQIGNGKTTFVYQVDENRPTPIVQGLSHVVDLSAGLTHTCAIASGGALSCWGDGTQGKLGDGTTERRLVPVRVPGLSAKSVSAGDHHTCAVDTDGSVWCWGAGDFGRLGNGDERDRSTPTLVPGIDDAVAVSAGTDHTCALRTRGEVLCWGAGYSGQLGIAGLRQSSTPVAVPGIHDAAEVNAGTAATCVRAVSSSISCWGASREATATSTPSDPVAVDGLSAMTSISAGPRGACAVATGGGVTCWGDGQLGAEEGRYDETLGIPVAPSLAARPVPILGTHGAMAVDAGGAGMSGCSVDRYGRVKCWNRSASWFARWPSRQHLAERTAQLLPGLSGVTALATAFERRYSEASTCALLVSETVRCWGSLAGQSAPPTRTPVAVSGLTGVKAIAGSGSKSATSGFDRSQSYCALLTNGGVRCWGDGSDGRLGNGSNVSSQAPVAVSGVSQAKAIAAGGGTTCVIVGAGGVRCWGEGSRGQLGNGAASDSATPVPVSGLVDAVALDVGERHACAVRAFGAIRCWGAGDAGQRGGGVQPDATTSTPVAGLFDATAVALGERFSCALRAAGTVACWGDGRFGALGDGPSPTGHAAAAETATPVVHAPPVNEQPPSILGIARPGNTLRCLAGRWSANTKIVAFRWSVNGRVNSFNSSSHTVLATDDLSTLTCRVIAFSDDDTRSTDVPATAASLPGASTIAAGSRHTCAVRASGSASCWGDGAYGRLGRGVTGNAPTPARVFGLTDARSIAAGDRHTCAVRADGHVQCWGFGAQGQLGDGSTTNAYKPVTVAGLSDAVTVAVGDRHTCALRTTARVVCWGAGASGRLGNGSSADALTPTPVSGLTDVVAITAGARHSCAVLGDGTAWCWGAGEFGRLGDARRTSSNVPVKALNITDAVTIDAGQDHTCVVGLFGLVQCWGRGDRGQIGNGAITGSAWPVGVFRADFVTPRAIRVSAGSDHTCVAEAEGTGIWCWGAGAAGQLGTGATADARIPARLPGDPNVTAIAAGDQHTCARQRAGTMQCWGKGAAGELGAALPAGQSTSLVPIAVMGLSDVR